MRLEMNKIRDSSSRAADTFEYQQIRRKIECSRQTISRTRIDLQKASFSYDKDFNYGMHRDVVIGQLSTMCLHCHALKFQRKNS